MVNVDRELCGNGCIGIRGGLRLCHGLGRCRGFAIGRERRNGLVAGRGRRRELLVARSAVLEHGHEVTQDLLADEHPALDLTDLGRLDIEVDEEVARLTVLADVVREATLAPRRDLAEAATAVDDGASDLLHRGLELVVFQVRTEQEHEFVTAHGVRRPPLSGDAASIAMRGRTRQKGVMG